MVPPDDTDYAQARRKVATLVENPAQSRSLVPAVVGLLDHEDRHLRLSAACGVCLVATADADLLSYLLDRLVDRLHEDDARPEVVFAFEYILTQYPQRADEVLQEMREEGDREPLAYSRGGGFRRSNIYSQSEGDRDVGRTRMVGDGRSPGPHQVYTDDVDVEAERRLREDEEEATDEDGAGGSVPDEDGDDSVSEAGTGTGEESVAGAATGEEPTPRDVPTAVLAAMLDGPVFDDVTIQSAGGRGRFAAHYRLLGIVRGRESAVDLRVYRYPERGRTRFLDRLDAALSRWAGLSDDGIVQCHDWGTDPRPWVAVEYTGSALADRSRHGVDAALESAIQTVGTVARLHAADTIHGGIEPRAIAYSAELGEEATGSEPMLDDVGILEAFRYPYDPSAMLDPRFAAPEYFDASYGAVDHATDIYQLGAVCYRLLTGRPPYDVPPEAARERVLGGPLPSPSSAVESVPGMLDGPVQKAMAKQKLTRYESAAQMEQDLLRVRDELINDG